MKIKSGILKRCSKDYNAYKNELTTLEEKLATLKAEEAEEHKVRRAEEYVAETA